jgi:superfamily I DNA/RNA helicase/RecB family exonuclease
VIEQRLNPSDWPPAIAEAEGRQLVVGGPGTGKTEFLVRRAAWLIEHDVPPEEVLLLSFSRRGVADLRERVRRRLDRTRISVPAMTFHALASRILSDQVPALLTSPEQVALVHHLLGREDPRHWPIPFRPLLTTDAFAAEVTDFLLRCSEQLIGPDDLAASERADWAALPGFMRRYRQHLAAVGRIDYGSLLVEAVRILDRDASAARHEFILVDEYQDTTAAQVGLLRRVSTSNLTVAADPYQSIYSFRGADLRNVARFAKLFGEPVRRVVLTTSFRVPAEILSAAERMVAGGALPGAAGPVVPAAGTGSVEAYRFAQQSEEAEWLAREIQRLHLEQGHPFASMAVFVRSKRHFLPELSRALDRRGIPHDHPDARLVDHPAVRAVFDCATAATSTGVERDRALQRLLLGRLFELPLGQMRELERLRATDDAPWPDLLRREVDGGRPLGDLLADPTWATSMPAIEGFWHVWTRLPQLSPVATDARRSEERAALTSLAQVLGRLVERDPSMSLDVYRRMSAEEDFEATPLLSYRLPDQDRLTLTTLHQSKGLQFDFVFVADAVEGTFPDLRPRESLLGSRHLNPSLPDDTPGYLRFRLQEEMRLAYTAMSRARRRVVWTCTTRGFDQGRGMPSRFFAAIAGVETVESALVRPREAATPVTPMEAEVWLRRIAGDPGESAARRTAAVSLLIEAPTWKMRPWRQFAGTAPRGGDTGLIEGNMRMSPSRAEAYLSCPRRFAFERLLHIGGAPSRYAAVGLVLHQVLETVERQAMERGAAHATVEEALERLDSVWNPADFGGAPWADSWRRRAERILERLYSMWPSEGMAVALEHPLRMTFEGVEWYGKADRIERREDGLTIVDYKTGATPLSLDDAAVSLQLGFYTIAADAAFSEEVTGAEMWFPAKKDAKSVPVRSLVLDRIAEVEEGMRVATAGILAEDWSPLPGKDCERCAVRLVCPEWPEGQEAFTQ